MAAKYLIAYDICHPRRLKRIHALLLGYGIALQYSVFYAELAPAQLTRLMAELADQIAPLHDKISVYALHEFDLAQWGRVNARMFNQAVLVL
ncbi:TPA: CRISPR-associated endonuclease Cas2 [Aeromonas veronii]